MALRRPTPKGRVRLDPVPPQQPQAEVEAKPRPPQVQAQTNAPNPHLEKAIQEADASPEPDASNEEAKTKPKRSATVLKVVKDIANAADPRPSRKVPDAAEWEPYLQRGLVYASVFYIWWLTTDDEGNELGDTSKYELDDERASLIVPPFARVWARTPFNRRYGRDMIENFDVLVSSVAIVTYIMDTRPLWAAKRQRQQMRNSDNKVIPMRREQTKTAPAPAPVQSKPPTPEPLTPTNGGTQPNDNPERTIDESPFKQPIGWTPGQQHNTD